MAFATCATLTCWAAFGDDYGRMPLDAALVRLRSADRDERGGALVVWDRGFREALGVLLDAAEAGDPQARALLDKWREILKCR